MQAPENHPELAPLGVELGDWLPDWVYWAGMALAGAMALVAMAVIVLVLAGCDKPAARPVECVPAVKSAAPKKVNV